MGAIWYAVYSIVPKVYPNTNPCPLIIWEILTVAHKIRVLFGETIV